MGTKCWSQIKLQCWLESEFILQSYRKIEAAHYRNLKDFFFFCKANLMIERYKTGFSVFKHGPVHMRLYLILKCWWCCKYQLTKEINSWSCCRTSPCMAIFGSNSIAGPAAVNTTEHQKLVLVYDWDSQVLGFDSKIMDTCQSNDWKADSE